MGQVWSKADFDGLNETGHEGGHGSVLAVTAQNPGPDGKYVTADDVLAPLNIVPADVSIDWTPGSDCQHTLDRIRGFFSYHPGGANFVLADGSVQFIGERISATTYIGLSTIDGEEVVPDPAL
ncbi:MAG: H-X9-DG-CTERM domain-containing protein [Bythopirellula sp.]